MAASVVFTHSHAPCVQTCAASQPLSYWQNYLESEMFTIQTNKGPPTHPPPPSPTVTPPPVDAAEGPIHMQIIIDFHSARQSGEPKYGSQNPTSFIPITRRENKKTACYNCMVA